jgi:hypothetical protein
MDPLLFTTYLASAALGPAFIGSLTATAYLVGRDENAVNNSYALRYSAAVGLISTPFLRQYGEVSRDLEKCVMKEPKVKLCSDGTLKVVPYLEARREALEAAVPVWFYYAYPFFSYAIETPNDNYRILCSMAGTTFAGLAAACRFQNAWASQRFSVSEYDSQLRRSPGEDPLKPTTSNFDKVDSYASRLDRGQDNGGVLISLYIEASLHSSLLRLMGPRRKKP